MMDESVMLGEIKFGCAVVIIATVVSCSVI